MNLEEYQKHEARENDVGYKQMAEERNCAAY